MEFENWNFTPDTTDLRPITFPFWMAKAIALDLEEKQHLEMEAELYALEVETYHKLLQSMEEKGQQRQLQIGMMSRNIALLQTQLRAEQQLKKGASTLEKSLRHFGALVAGFLLGRFLQ